MTSPTDAYSKVVAKAWSDDAYKQRLLDDPGTVLSEAGVAVPEGTKVRMVENTATVAHFVIPAAPSEGEISEEALGQVSGGTACCCGYSHLCT